MSRDRSEKRERRARQTYTAAPVVPAELRERYELLMAVLSGELTVSEAARRMGVARNHFQTLMHRAVGGLIDGLSPRPTGRPPRPEREVELEEQLVEQSLERQLAGRAVGDDLDEAEALQRALGLDAGQPLRFEAGRVDALARVVSRLGGLSPRIPRHPGDLSGDAARPTVEPAALRGITDGSPVGARVPSPPGALR